MAQTNMDTKKNPTATVPVMEFMLPMSEVDASLSTGQLGSILIPVEVVSVSDGMVTFRKNAAVSTEGNFRSETTAEMRERILKEQDKETKKEDSKE